MKNISLMLLLIASLRAAAFGVDLGPPPNVNAGTDKIVNTQTFQNATVSGATLMSWTQQSGPAGGTLVFGSPLLEDTTISANVEGVYVARLTATSLLLNTAYDEMTFVWDVTPPSITPPQDIVVEATSSGGAIVTYPPPTISDATATTYSASYASGSQFSLGTTTVTIIATDAAGNSSSTAFHVTVRDTTPPAIHGDIVIEAVGPDGAVAQFVAAADSVDPAPLINATPASGSQFPLGMNTVSVTATDASGNTANGSFLVIVRDTTPPVLFPPADVTVAAQNSSGATVNYDPATAQDTVSEVSIKYSHDSGSTFPVGLTRVLVTAMDASGNSTLGTFLVTVTDPDAPVISSPMTITPNPATVADQIKLTAGFSTTALTWNWDFGDGTTSSSQGVIIHTYGTPGVYTVTLTVTDSLQRSTVQSAPISVTSVPAGGGSGGGGGGGSGPPQDAVDIALSGKVKSTAPGKDQYTLKCKLPSLSSSLQLSGASVSINIGGASANFTLDAKGRAKSVAGNAALKILKTHDATLQVKAIGSFQDTWTLDGLDLAVAVSKGTAQFFIFINLNGQFYSADVPTTTKIIATKSGQFKSR